MKSKKQDWQAVNASEVEEQVNDNHFIHKEKCNCSFPIHNFHIVGEQIEGRLRPCENRDISDRAKTAHICFDGEDGKEITICIRLLSMIKKAVEKDHLWGQWIRITYRGIKKLPLGRDMKVFLVEVDKGAITEKFEPCDVTPEECKSRKPRKPKPIRRPLTSEKKKK